MKNYILLLAGLTIISISNAQEPDNSFISYFYLSGNDLDTSGYLHQSFDQNGQLCKQIKSYNLSCYPELYAYGSILYVRSKIGVDSVFYFNTSRDELPLFTSLSKVKTRENI
jgi:hypothetical protein